MLKKKPVNRKNEIYSILKGTLLLLLSLALLICMSFIFTAAKSRHELKPLEVQLLRLFSHMRSGDLKDRQMEESPELTSHALKYWFWDILLDGNKAAARKNASEPGETRSKR